MNDFSGAVSAGNTNKLMLFGGLIILIISLVFIIYYWKNIKEKLLPTLILLSKYIYLVFVIPAIIFLMIDWIIEPDISNEASRRVYYFFRELAIITFSAGIFSASIKFLDVLNVFKKNFKDIIMSEDFNNIISNNVEKLAYSEDHLLKQNNLNEIWEQVTLCKYKKDFKEIHLKLKKKISNDLFTNSSISYYNKNFQVNYKIKLLENDVLEIIETTTATT
uniref:hypothetical protein n=1 Tax=Mangrovimonas sp. ST2L15 TaxID=1645916 RepID=UPI000A8CD5D1